MNISEFYETFHDGQPKYPNRVELKLKADDGKIFNLLLVQNRSKIHLLFFSFQIFQFCFSFCRDVAGVSTNGKNFGSSGSFFDSSNHCYYEGRLQGFPKSHAAINLCNRAAKWDFLWPQKTQKPFLPPFSFLPQPQNPDLVEDLGPKFDSTQNFYGFT